MDDGLGWSVTRGGDTEVVIAFRAGPAPLTARLTRTELDRITGLLDDAVAAGRRGEYSRIRLGAALREAIGRDPLTSPARDRERDAPWFPVWAALAYLVVGLGGATRTGPVWLRIAGGVLAGCAAVDLLRRPLRRHRRRLR